MGRTNEDEKDDDLSVDELEAALEYCHDLAEEALKEGSRDELVKALSTISDIGNPDSILDVDVDNVTVEISGWEK